MTRDTSLPLGKYGYIVRHALTGENKRSPDYYNCDQCENMIDKGSHYFQEDREPNQAPRRHCADCITNIAIEAGPLTRQTTTTNENCKTTVLTYDFKPLQEQ